MDSNVTNATSTEIAIAVFHKPAQVETAVRSLQRAGFYMRKISIIAKDGDGEDRVVGFISNGFRTRVFGRHGAQWGDWMRVLIGSAMMYVPGIGHVIILGPLATALFRGIKGAGGSVRPLVDALGAVGIADDAVLRYESALRSGLFLLAVQGAAREIERVRDVLEVSDLPGLETCSVTNRPVVDRGGASVAM